MNRHELSHLYASGMGIEIGAYHNPFPKNPKISQMVYVDKWPYEKLIEMRNNDSNLGAHIPISRVDIVEDGETLNSIKDSVFDFLVSSHHLEHCFSPLNAIENHLRVIKTGGYLIYAVPDKTQTFDRNREVTPLDHIIDHYTFPQHQDMAAHFHEYLSIVDNVTDSGKRTERVEAMIKNGEDVHFHCWDFVEMSNMFKWAEDNLAFKCKIEMFKSAGHEIFIVLRKQG